MNAIELIRKQLVESELMSEEKFDSEISSWRDQSDAKKDDVEAFVDWLINEQRLTEFQGEALRAGHAGPFMLGPYRVFEQMAIGRLGNIYRAVHDEHDQNVSLKVFPSSLKEDSEKLARMQREVKASIDLDHPNVVRTFEMGQEGDIYYLAFEDLQGETLQTRLDRAGKFNCQEACKLMREAATLVSEYATRVRITLYAAGEDGADLVLAQQAGTLSSYLLDPKRQPDDRHAAREIVQRQVEAWTVHKAPAALTRARKWDGDFRLGDVLSTIPE